MGVRVLAASERPVPELSRLSPFLDRVGTRLGAADGHRRGQCGIGGYRRRRRWASSLPTLGRCAQMGAEANSFSLGKTTAVGPQPEVFRSLMRSDPKGY